MKPKNYTRDLSEVDYKLQGYIFEHENLEKKDSTRGIAVYIRETLCYTKIDNKRSQIRKFKVPKEILSLDIDLKNGENFN